MLTSQQACDRYCMTAGELARWVKLLETEGLHGLSAGNFANNYPADTLEDVRSFRDGALSIDFATQIVRVNDRLLHFTKTQLRLLSILIRRAPAAVRRAEVYAFLYGDEPGPQPKILDVMICKIRQRLGDNVVQTVWGRGWRWRSPGLAERRHGQCPARHHPAGRGSQQGSR